MLVIRKAQMDSFRQERMRLAIRDLANYIRGTSADLVREWTTTELEAGLVVARDKAAQCAITDALSVAQYFVAMVTYSADFDQHPTVRKILIENSGAPDHGIHAVWQGLTNADWMAVTATGSAPLLPGRGAYAETDH